MIWVPYLLDTVPEITRLPGPATPPDWYTHGPIIAVGIVCFIIGYVARGVFRER